METRWARVLRGWTAGGFATLVAAISHAIAGGSFASTLGLLLALMFSGVTCMALAGRRLSLARLSISVLLSQFAFHLVFSAISAGGGQVIGNIGHHGGGYLLISGNQAAMNMTSIETSGWMWLAHVLAAAVTIAALRFGEAAFWGLRDSARMLVAAIWRGIPAAPAFVAATDAGPVASRSIAPRIQRGFLEAVRYRGPPVGIRFA
jgi:hypothetical protein